MKTYGFGYSYTKDEVLKFMDADSYMVYSERYANVPRGTDTIVIEGGSYDASQTDAEVEVLDEFEGKTNVIKPRIRLDVMEGCNSQDRQICHQRRECLQPERN